MPQQLVDVTQVHLRKSDVLVVKEAMAVCFYDWSRGIAVCTGVKPTTVVILANDPFDMAATLLTIHERLRREGIPAKPVVAIDRVYVPHVELGIDMAQWVKRHLQELR